MLLNPNPMFLTLNFSQNNPSSLIKIYKRAAYLASYYVRMDVLHFFTPFYTLFSCQYLQTGRHLYTGSMNVYFPGPLAPTIRTGMSV